MTATSGRKGGKILITSSIASQLISTTCIRVKKSSSGAEMGIELCKFVENLEQMTQRDWYFGCASQIRQDLDRGELLITLSNRGVASWGRDNVEIPHHVYL